MRTLLLIAEHPSAEEAVVAALRQEQWRVIQRTSVETAEPLLEHGIADACLLEVDLSSVQGIWPLEKVRRRAPNCPVILLASAKMPEWEEEAYLKGAMQVLVKPLRPRLLNALLERLSDKPGDMPAAGGPRPGPVAWPLSDQPQGRTAVAAAAPANLEVLREFSTILTHSLNAEGMLKQFLLLLHELLSINRGAIFLRQPFGTLAQPARSPETHRLRAAGSLGLSTGLLEHLELSLDSGIGGQLFRLGRILRRSGEEVRNDVEAQKEFELLGAQVAIPILDRETILGLAVFDSRITGEPLVNSELELIFHLLEQLGLAVKNIWLHDQLSANHQLLAEILRELSSACVVVSRDLVILHANKTASRYFAAGDRRGRALEFSDLPEPIGTRVYQVLKTGSAVSSFRYESTAQPGIVYSINVVPFQQQSGGLPGAALLTAEDLTQVEQFRRLEVEAANLRLVRAMADRLTHEIGNALVPLSTHQQLLADKWKDPEFRSSLDGALAEGVKRVTRLITQMRFLARDTLAAQESFPLAPLIDEAYQEACKYQPAKSAQLRYEQPAKPIVVSGDRAALKHAFTEVILNALQANPTDPKIGVRLHASANGNQGGMLQIEVQDNGAGFPPDVLKKAPAPFFTTRNVGLGLGLMVSRKILETHHGKLELLPTATGQSGIVRISLPFEGSVTLQA